MTNKLEQRRQRKQFTADVMNVEDDLTLSTQLRLLEAISEIAPEGWQDGLNSKNFLNNLIGMVNYRLKLEKDED